MLDEVPAVFLIPSASGSDAADEIIAACQRYLADFKVPRTVRVVDELLVQPLRKLQSQTL